MNTPSSLTPERLLETHFWPLYPDDVRNDPEFRTADANPVRNPHLVAHLVEAAELFVAQAPQLLDTSLTFDDAGIARLSSALSRTRRDQWLASPSTPHEPSLMFNAVVHAAAFVGETIVRAHKGRWLMRRPMWESVVVRPDHAGGGAVTPFVWLLKHLSDNEIDQGTLAWRYQVHVVLASAEIDQLPVILAPRSLPPLVEPRYDTLVKYLHQHLPMLRDLGTGFLSPAEFTQRQFSRMGFEIFHEGRVIALHGQSPSRDEQPSTVEVFWLTAAGFDHSDLFPADAGTPYFARRTADALEVTLAWKQRPHTHVVGFRGHHRSPTTPTQ